MPAAPTVRSLLIDNDSKLLFNNYSSSPMGSVSIAHEAEGGIDSEAMRARGIVVLVKSNQLIKNIENKKF